MEMKFKIFELGYRSRETFSGYSDGYGKEHCYDPVLKGTHDSDQEFDTFIISVGTPVVSGLLDTSALKNATLLVSKRIRNGNLVVVRSTVSIGTSRNIVFDKLKRISPRAFLQLAPKEPQRGLL